MLAVESRDTLVLVDCGGDAAQRLLASGLELDRVSCLIVTHEHADHVGGFPLLMERLWLAGIGPTFDVYGIAPAIAQARRAHEVFDTSSWPGYPEIRYHEVDQRDDSLVLETDDLEVRASPGRHAVPVVGLRFKDKRGGGVMVSSGDTELCTAITDLAHGADLLVHEATGDSPGHSSAEDAATVAHDAEVGRLVLVHLPPGFDEQAEPLTRARQRFHDVQVGSDGARYDY